MEVGRDRISKILQDPRESSLVIELELELYLRASYFGSRFSKGTLISPLGSSIFGGNNWGVIAAWQTGFRKSCKMQEKSSLVIELELELFLRASYLGSRFSKITLISSLDSSIFGGNIWGFLHFITLQKHFWFDWRWAHSSLMQEIRFRS